MEPGVAFVRGFYIQEPAKTRKTRKRLKSQVPCWFDPSSAHSPMNVSDLLLGL
jgi:hypothetical protein